MTFTDNFINKEYGPQYPLGVVGTRFQGRIFQKSINQNTPMHKRYFRETDLKCIEIQMESSQNFTFNRRAIVTHTSENKSILATPPLTLVTYIGYMASRQVHLHHPSLEQNNVGRQDKITNIKHYKSGGTLSCLLTQMCHIFEGCLTYTYIDIL